MLNMIFNRINFHGHLRLSGVCQKWHNLVQNDVPFMRTVQFQAEKLTKRHKLMRSYRNVFLKNFSWEKINVTNNLQKLLENAERIDFGFGYTERATLNCLMPLCGKVKEIRLYRLSSYYHDKTAFTFEHKLPVRITVNELCSEFLDRFTVIENISGLEIGLNAHAELLEDFMAKHGALVNSFSCIGSGNVGLLSRIETLRLKSLRLYCAGCPDIEKELVREFFEKQAPFIKSFDISRGSMVVFMFDSMRMLLKNLETVRFTLPTNSDLLRLNDLRTLAKLQCLDLGVYQGDGQTYQLNVSELTALSDLRISGSGQLRVFTDQPMNALKKLTVSGLQLDIQTLEQIVQAMPRLKMLDIYSWVRK
jgi:hypothetical protein